MDKSMVDLFLNLAHSEIKNYVLPGMSSSLIGQRTEAGQMRIFHNSREQHDAVTPHSHRFDFTCLVLQGWVINRIWSPDETGDEYVCSTQDYNGFVGDYSLTETKVSRYSYSDKKFETGEWYSMKADEIHSIFFSKYAVVLFCEGPTVADNSVILEPFVDGFPIRTFQVKPWMFIKA